MIRLTWIWDDMASKLIMMVTWNHQNIIIHIIHVVIFTGKSDRSTLRFLFLQEFAGFKTKKRHNAGGFL